MTADFLNPSLATDFYKVGHISQYPTGTSLVYSNFTCRSDKYAGMPADFDRKVVFCGLQGLCQWLFQELWEENFFRRPRGEMVEAYRARVDGALGPGVARHDNIGALHDLGYLPIRIRALPEGSRVGMRIPLLTIRNTIPEFYWVTNFLETQLSAELWKPIRNATVAYWLRRMLETYAAVTGTPSSFIPFQAHDFSFRGMSGIHDAATAGLGHLLSFQGTDTIPGLDYAARYYGSGGLIGASVPATEHSVMCMGGQEGELDLISRLVTDLYPRGIVSIVSDSWDFWKVIGEYARVLKEEILARGAGEPGLHKVVFRPDSGDPVKVICGDEHASSPEARAGAVETLWHIFGGSETPTGHRLLDPHVGVIYGDSITPERAAAILKGLEAKGFASGNIVFGVGSWTYQLATRDTFGCAIKTTYGEVDGQGREVYKDPVTDSGTKKSARGLLRVEKVNGEFVLHEQQDWGQEAGGCLETVFLDGTLLRHQSLDAVRQRLWPAWQLS